MRVAAAVALAALLAASACTQEDSAETVDSDIDELPYFVVDNDAVGPLTLEELNINVPARVALHWSDSKMSCFLAAVERRAADAGDPETLNPDDLPYWETQDTTEQWPRFTPHMRRVLLAQAVISWAAV
ncbi:MAG: hypothetical protein AAFX10_11585, partial [Pseudomonadota bacterium]